MSISSFFWLNSLVRSIENGHATLSQVSHISQLGLKPMLYQRFNGLTEHDRKWLNIAKVLARNDGDIAFTLAKYYLAVKVKNTEIQRSVKLWLSQAIRHNNHQARILLAKIYINENEINAAKKILKPIENNISAIQLLLELSISAGEKTRTADYINRLKSLKGIQQNKELENLYLKLDKYEITNSSTNIYTKECLATIAPFATNLENLAYFEELIASSKLAILRPYICFSPIKYISKIELNCRHDAREAISCDESIWEYNKNLVSQKNRFIAVLVEKGGANVNSGILYIDSLDSEEVFIHELAHLLGFIDEYALPKSHTRCLNVQNASFSHNIAVLPRFYQGSKANVRKEILEQLPWNKYISTSTSLLTKTSQGWQLGTKGGDKSTVGAFIAETCNEKDFVAVKPLNKRTAMRYFEENLPSLYLKLIADNPKRFLMPNYQLNVIAALQAKK